MTKEFNHVFDYGSLTDEHKEAAGEIAKVLNEKGLESIASEILTNFKIKSIPKYDSNSPFWESVTEAGMFAAVQGHTIEKDQHGNQMEYPLIVLCDDIRKFENLYNIIEKNIKNEKD